MIKRPVIYKKLDLNKNQGPFNVKNRL